MAARLIAEVEAAPILNTALVRGATEAAHQLESWADKTKNTVEAYNACSIALVRLKKIERKAKRIKYELIAPDTIVSLGSGIMQLQKCLNRTRTSDEKVTSTSQTWQEEEDDGQDTSTEGDSDFCATSRLSMDIQRSSVKAFTHCFVLWFLVILIIVFGAVAIIFIEHSSLQQGMDEIERNVTMELALVAQAALDTFFDILQERNVDIRVGREYAVDILSQMTSSIVSDVDAQLIFAQSNNYLTEYRAGMVNFGRQNHVDTLLTKRAFGSICQKNMTYAIEFPNDVFTNSSYVIPTLTANKCANDAASGGIFATVIPTFVNYVPSMETYRRGNARVASFYHSGFQLAVVVTHDRKTLQETLTPEATLLGHITKFRSTKQEWSAEVWMWSSLIVAVSALLIAGLLLWLMATSIKYWMFLFPVLIGLIGAVTLIVLMCVVQWICGNTYSDALQLAVSSMVKGAASVLVSSPMVEFDGSTTFAQVLVNDVLRGRFFLSNVDGSTIIPEFMKPIAETVEARKNSLFRRGEFTDEVNHYAVASSFINSISWNLIMAVKLPPDVHADDSIAMALLFGLLCGATVFFYMRWSPLSWLRSYAVGMPVLRYHVHPSTLRYLFYLVLVIFSVAGMVSINSFGTIKMENEMIFLAKTTLVIVSSYIRSQYLVDMCTYGCGMPDFTVLLYFTQKQEGDNPYPVISFIMQDISLPIPQHADWETRYYGAELAMSNIHTTLLDMPSFSTPIINRTINVTDPRSVVRNMLSTTGVNDTAGFALERFPASFYPKAYSFRSHSIGLCIVIVLCAVIIAVCEWQYIKLHQRFQRKDSLIRPFVIMGFIIFLLATGFLAHLVALKFLLSSELLAFTLDELSLMARSVGYRLELLCLQEAYESREQMLDSLGKAASAASTSSRLVAPRFSRIRLAVEYPVRGSGKVQILGVETKETVDIGRLDNGYVPVCGTIDGKWISDHVDGNMRYCFVEISQNPTLSITSGLDTPRIFSLAAISVPAWSSEIIDEIWPIIVAVGLMIVFVVIAVSTIFFFWTMNAAYAKGFPLLKEEEVNLLTECLPQKFSVEFFLPAHHRLIWISSMLILASFIVYYSVSVGSFIYAIREDDAVTAAFETQENLLKGLIKDARCDAYNYIIFPVASVTVGNLLALKESSGSASLPYVFITHNGLQLFQKGVQFMYDNLTLTGGVFNQMLQAANEGYGSYASFLAASYDEMFITNQKIVFSQINQIQSRLEQDVAAPTISTNYEKCIVALRDLVVIRDLIRKIFVLDHIAISSYADFAQQVYDTWPWPNNPPVENIFSATFDAKDKLVILINTALRQLKTDLGQASPESKDSFNYLVQQVSDFYSSAYAINNINSPVWRTQSNRCDEALSMSNETRSIVAKLQKNAKVAAVELAAQNFSIVISEELNARKSNQLMDYLTAGRPIEDQLITVAWQRWSMFNRVQRKYIVCFCCTLCCFVFVAISLFFHVKLMRRRTIIATETQLRQNHDNGRCFDSCDIQDPHKVENIKKSHYAITASPSNFGGASAAGRLCRLKEEDSIVMEKSYSEKDVQSENSLSTDSSLGKDALGNMASIKSAQDNQQYSIFHRRERWVIVVLSCFTALTLIPLCCSFWMLILSRRTAVDHLQDVSVILSLYPSVMSLIEKLSNLLLHTVQFYVGEIGVNDLMIFLSQCEKEVDILQGMYLWDLDLTSSSVVSEMTAAFRTVHDIVVDEVNHFNAVIPNDEIPDYPTPQSAYAREFLPTISDANRFASLIPMASNSGGAVETFATDAYQDALSQVQSITTASDFSRIYANYINVVQSLDHISDAELQMWHATVAAVRTKGAPTAVEYSTFTTLVGSLGLAGISSSTLPSAAAALSEVQDYYKDLLDQAGTSEQVEALFTTTDSPPTSYSTSSSAYFAAAYCVTRFYHMVTETKFSNIFGYNRGLTKFSADLGDAITLVEAMENLHQSFVKFILSVSEGNSVIVPTRFNTWIWSTEIMVEQTSNRDHADLTYLENAIGVCNMVSFWVLLLVILMGTYLFFKF